MYDVIMTKEDNGVYDEDGDVLGDGDYNITDAVASVVIVLRVTVLIIYVYSVLVSVVISSVNSVLVSVVISSVNSVLASVEISFVLVVVCIHHPLTVC